MKTIVTIIGACLIGTCGGYYTVGPNTIRLASLDGVSTGTESAAIPGLPAANERKTLSGDYLSSIFAQTHHDWKKAGQYLSDVMKQTPGEPSLPKRAMVLAMGSGDVENAIALAKQVAAENTKKSTDTKDAKDGTEGNALAELFIAVGAFHDKDYTTAAAHIKTMPKGSLSDFIMPLLESWADAGTGVYNVSKLSGNTIHIHHAVLISDLMGKKIDVNPLLKKIAQSQELTLEDVERMANIYAHTGNRDMAITLYQKVLEQWPQHPTAGKDLAALKKGETPETIIPVKSPEEGVAATLYDMANLLYREYADDSARVFSQMALYLMPSMSDARLLLAAIDARNQRYDEAIASYTMIKPDSEYFLDAQRRAADLMEDSGKTNDALAELNMLAKDHNDLESLIKIGDIYRRQENFPKAIEVYNQAAKRVGDPIPKEYWNLLYVRGISYERAGQWNKAEADLKASLAYQPDHPFILNYLAYAWADQGIHLDEALDLSKKAAAAQPNDGYIADSLGWVLYRMGRYTDSLSQLERAIELLPYDPVINDHLGDAYWQQNRKREARFQWQRAVNYSSDKDLIAKIDGKIQNGLVAAKTPVKEAHTQTGEAATAIP